MRLEEAAIVAFSAPWEQALGEFAHVIAGPVELHQLLEHPVRRIFAALKGRKGEVADLAQCRRPNASVHRAEHLDVAYGNEAPGIPSSGQNQIPIEAGFRF
jgi:hypothetical protein